MEANLRILQAGQGLQDAKEDPALQQILQTACAVQEEGCAPCEGPTSGTCRSSSFPGGQNGPNDQNHARGSSGSRCL
eukprot:4371515-Amphidinium_carterae.1